MEETLEMITWSQLGIHKKAVGLLNVDGYYNSLLNLFDSGVNEGFIKPRARQIVIAAPTAKELLIKMEVKCVEVFKEFYETRTKHRKLTWIYSLGTCNVTGKFEPKTMELMVSTFQAAVLLLFNASDQLSDDDLVSILLQSLSCAKYLLIKAPKQ